jgi:hypothetical protein
MVSRRCCRDDFVLGSLNHVADGFRRVCIKPLGLSIGDQSRFDGERSSRQKTPVSPAFPWGAMRCSGSCATKWTSSDTDVHGFRKTFKNSARNRGFDPELIERSLDHAYGSQIERVYQDDQLVERRCEMLEAWADYCNGSPAEIIRLPVRRRKAG